MLVKLSNIQECYYNTYMQIIAHLKIIAVSKMKKWRREREKYDL